MTRLSLLLFLSLPSFAQWTPPVHVEHDNQPVISYRAQLAGDYLVVEASLADGWKTFAMDNQKRADEKLAGKKALGIDRETSITVSGGLTLTNGWLQTPPKDYSRPELRWFTWGYQGKALFAAKVARKGSGVAALNIKGQACTESVCKNIDVDLNVPLAARPAPAIDLSALIPVR
jgi:hypothetical protein